MTKTDTMAKLPGLHARAGVYQLRVMIPLDLQAAFGGRTKLIESLNTADNSTAKLLGTALRAVRLSEFDQKRRELNPLTVDRITPELGKALAQRVYAAALTRDDTLRGNPKVAQALLLALRTVVPNRLTIGPVDAPAFLRAAIDPMEGLSLELAEEIARLNGAIDAQAALAQATQRAAAILPMAQAEALKLGFLLDPKSPGAMEALRECLKAHRRARSDIARRDHGDVVETPETVTAATPPKLQYLRDIFPLWRASKPRKPGSIRACELALESFEKQSGNPPLQDITRQQGEAFRAWLQQLGGSSKTAHDRLTWVKGLLRYAFRDLELIHRQPWEVNRPGF